MSTHKIIFFSSLVCTAIISALFVFYLSHRPHQVLLSTNDAVVFSVPRELKSFELNATNQQKFTEKNFYNHWTLLFFGFTHCAKVCPTNLDLMNRVYQNLINDYPNLQVVLISLDPDRDNLQTLTHYVQSFNPNFIGATGSIQSLHKLQSQLGIFSARDDSQSTTDYQIQHTSSILLINPQGRWAGLFKYGLTKAAFIKSFKESVS